MNSMETGLGFVGHHVLEIYRNGELVKKIEAFNAVTNAAMNDMLNRYFNAGTAYGTSYLGLVSASGFTNFAAADTMLSHAGWSEFVSYSESTRPAWTQGTAASQAVSNAVQVTYTINNAGTIQGAFLVNDNTKAGTGGLLFSTATLQAGPTPVVTGDVIKHTYTIRLAS